ncbi:MAG: helix-turn-helix transcriptional regulator [Lamprobacter sp.]|uniref:helix-turn-helix domain-containing protein n=1 Tax=Lamprobacter sp. TaxID=3100796 RepID=UPI002B25C895|nr:helix-turn-helix transcriptional regulator [Lamprobacter sp.]MEA3641544.1 helix-turn-helix transcriptional regulator [Lamprobacter sp.]
MLRTFYDDYYEVAQDADDSNYKKTFYSGRSRYIVRPHITFAGFTQAQVAEALEISSTYAQRVQQSSVSSPLINKRLPDFLSLPEDLLDPDSFIDFYEKCPVYCATLDALVNNYPRGGVRKGVMPTDYTIRALRSYLRNHQDDFKALREYFKDPAYVEEPGISAQEDIESALDLPPGSVTAHKSYSKTLLCNDELYKSTTSLVSANIEKLLDDNSWDPSDLAEKAGIPTSRVERLLDMQKLSLNSLIAFSCATGIEPYRLLLPDLGHGNVGLNIDLSDTFKELPVVARNMISNYLSLIRRDADGANPQAQAMLILTPFIVQLIDIVGKTEFEKPQSMGEVAKGLEEAIRLGVSFNIPGNAPKSLKVQEFKP